MTARAVLFTCGLTSAIGCALMPLLIDGPAIWPPMFILGAVSYGIYTMTLIELGEKFSGAMLVAGNAAFALMWGAGGIVVTPAVGAAMDVLGARGLPISLGLICLALSLAIAFRPRARTRG